MTSLYNYSTRFILFCLLCLSLNLSFAQGCPPLTLDSISNPGQYTFASLTEGDGIRNGPGYNGATIYYPTNATPPFSGMAIVPGYVSAQSSIQNWGPFLASHGIVTMTIGTNSFFDQPEDRRDALLDALITIKGENTRSASPLFGNIDTNSMAVGGWSMGGGGAQLAAAADPSLKAVMALCPWLDANNLSASDLNHSVPVLIFSGESDGVAPPNIHADVHYNYTPQNTRKMLFEIASGNHSVANDPIGGGNYVGKIAVSWLQNYLMGDTCYCPLVLDTPPTASKYLLNVECSNLVSIEENERIGNIQFQLYPNPCMSVINLKMQNFKPGTNYQVLTMAGVMVIGGEMNSQSTNIPVDGLSSGFYIFNLHSTEGSKQTKFIVQ